MICVRYRRRELSIEQAEQLCSLWAEVWPNGDQTPLAERACDLLSDTLPEQRMQPGSELFHLVEENGAIVSVARSFVREVRFEEQGGVAPLLALASVCTWPKHRGRGLGACVVRDAFSRLGPELPWCLYQTQAHGFYEKLGARLVGNVFRNSLAADGEARPWWDESVMVYAPALKWPSGRVDLCGAAY